MAVAESGLRELALEIVAAAARQTTYVSLQRRKAERPLAEARVSQTLFKLDNQKAASEVLERAWSNASGLGEGSGEKSKKAQALLAIAEAASLARMIKHRN